MIRPTGKALGCAANCECSKKNGMGFLSIPTAPAEWPWPIWLLLILAGWIAFREFSDRSGDAPRPKKRRS